MTRPSDIEILKEILGDEKQTRVLKWHHSIIVHQRG